MKDITVRSVLINALVDYYITHRDHLDGESKESKCISDCISYLNENEIDKQWVARNYYLIYIACHCYHKTLDSYIREDRISSDEEQLAKHRKEREIIIALKEHYKKNKVNSDLPLH